MSAGRRLVYLDHLRALAMFAGLCFHAALAYSPLMHRYWLTADRQNSVWVDAVAWFLHQFRMPLFFALAGFSAARLVEERGVEGMLRNRCARVLLPLILFWPLVTVPVAWLAREAAPQLRDLPPMLDFLRQSGYPLYFPTLSHLWFLAYLMLFYLLVWIARTGEWTLPLWARSGWTSRKLAAGAPWLLAPALASVGAPTPAPEGLLPQFWAVFFYGAFFAFGFVGLGDGGNAAWRSGPSFVLLAASLTAYAGFWAMLPWRPSHAGVALLLAVLEAGIAVWMTLWCLTVGLAWLNTPRAWLSYLAGASYWIYLVHLPIVFAIQLPMLDWDLDWRVKWALSVSITLLLGLGSYQWVVRGTWLGRLLQGRRA